MEGGEKDVGIRRRRRVTVKMAGTHLVDVCVSEFSYKSLAGSNHRYNGMFECSPFPPDGDVRLPKDGRSMSKTEERCPTPSNVPWVLKKEKKIKSR